MGVAGAIQQTFERLVVHTPKGTDVWPLPWSFSTFDYRTLCRLLFEQTDAEFDTAKVDGITRGRTARDAHVVHTDRGDLRAPLIVDGLGWRLLAGHEHAGLAHPGPAVHVELPERSRRVIVLEAQADRVHEPVAGAAVHVRHEDVALLALGGALGNTEASYPVTFGVLMLGCLLLVLSFGSSTALAGTYGIAVTGDMIMTSLGFFAVRSSAIFL